MRRAEREGDRWSGQISLPGGHAETGDSDLLATAVRETSEEVGVPLSEVARFTGALPVIQARARGELLGMTIAPLVFQLNRRCAFQLGNEATAAFWFPLVAAGSGSLSEVFVYRRTNGDLVELPSWRLGEHVIWGLTHRILSGLIQCLGLEDEETS